MTGAEFSQWLEYHWKCFPALRKWMAEGGEGENVHGHWYQELFHELELEDCKWVSKAILLGEVEKPKGWGDHPKAFRAECSKLKHEREQSQRNGTFIDGVEVFDCDQCSGRGLIELVHWRFIEALMKGKDPGILTHCVIGCNCQNAPARLPKYDPNTWWHIRYRDGMSIDKVQLAIDNSRGLNSQFV